MPKKSTNNSLATKEDIGKVVSLLNGFATKTDLEQFATKLDLLGLKDEIIDMFDESEKKQTKYHDRILTNLDKVAGEIQTWREDKILSDSTLEEHGVRLTKLEHHN